MLQVSKLEESIVVLLRLLDNEVLGKIFPSWIHTCIYTALVYLLVTIDLSYNAVFSASGSRRRPTATVKFSLAPTMEVACFAVDDGCNDPGALLSTVRRRRQMSVCHRLSLSGFHQINLSTSPTIRVQMFIFAFSLPTNTAHV